MPPQALELIQPFKCSWHIMRIQNTLYMCYELTSVQETLAPPQALALHSLLFEWVLVWLGFWLR